MNYIDKRKVTINKPPLLAGRGDVALVATLLMLNVIPVAASISRLSGMLDSTELPRPEDARFVAAPLATILHLVSSGVFGVVGIGQFLDGVRRRWPSWHRRAGWVLAVSGLLSALSGLWMTAFFPRVEGDSDLLDAFRLLFGTAMAMCLFQGLRSALARNFQRHRGWMIRGYAIGIGAGTQVVVHIPWLMLALPSPDPLVRALLLGAGWMINLIIAEWFIARNQRKPRIQTARN